MMAYVGGKLASLFGRVPQAATDIAMREMAKKGGERMVELTIANTPIGGRYQLPDAEVSGARRGGNLRSSWYRLDVSRTQVGPFRGYQSGVASDVSYAPYVEHGTGLWGPYGRKYEITPKTPGGVLRWFDPKTGHEVLARRVWHPGSPGHHMVAIAGALTEREADGGDLFTTILDEWQRTVEGAAD